MALTKNNLQSEFSLSAYGFAGEQGSGTSSGRSSGRLQYAKSFGYTWVPTALVDNQITAIGFDTGSIAASSTETIDLFGGTLLDLSNEAIVFATIKFVAIFLVDSSGNTATVGRLNIGGAGSNPHILWFANTSDISKVEVGGPPFMQGAATGVAVDSTNRNIQISNPTGAAVNYVFLCAGTV